MGNLDVYAQQGFKFFLCKTDKSPDVKSSWMDSDSHLTQEEAERYQNIGTMIGAWLPEDIIVLDLDRHAGKPDGIAEFNKVKEKYNVDAIAFQSDTYCVRTQSGGFHVFFTARGHTFHQGAAAPGIDLKTHSGYVIAAGSPGYLQINDVDPMPLPDTLAQWLTDTRGSPEKPDQKKEHKKQPLLPASQLKRILKKLKVESFKGNEKWQRFITSAIATAGESKEVIEALDEWSRGDPEYAGDRSVSKRIESFRQEGGITIGTFINFLNEEGISQYLISKVSRLDSTNAVLIDAEKHEIQLPFGEPDYAALTELPEATAFYNQPNNSPAAELLAAATRGKAIFVEGEEKRFFFFDGNRWARLPDYYRVMFTVLLRIAKRKHAEEGKGNFEKMGSVLYAISQTKWKLDTAKEYAAKEGIFYESVKWDSIAIKETLTTKDGVIDFSEWQVLARKGRPEEFRRSHVPYTSAEILNAQAPTNYLRFLRDIFPNRGTYCMARYASSLCISGNATLRTFQIWSGGSSNGKSTLVETIKKVMGTEKAKTYEVKLLLEKKIEALGTTPELAQFEGAYAMFGIEVDSGKRFQSSIIKNMTGGDDITVNPKYQHVRDISPTWQLIFACNELPTFDSTDAAFLGRLLILPFRMRYFKNAAEKEMFEQIGVSKEYMQPAKNKDKLVSSLIEERAAIIRLMVNDYIKLMKRHKGAVPESKEAIQEKNSYREQNDLVGEFVKNACERDPDKVEYCASLSDLADAYSQFAGLRRDRAATSSFISRALLKYDARLKKAIIHIERDDGRKTTARALRFIRLKNLSEEALPF